MTKVIVETHKRLSQSLLWELQRKIYQQLGPEAWSEKAVPFYATSNPFIAYQYAHLILGYIRDCLAPNSATPIDLRETLYLLDLGAGTGRFGYLLLKNLREILKNSVFEKIKVCYVMTDFVPATLAFWQNHPYLKPWIAEGLLDFAYYDHQQDTVLELILTKRYLTSETIKNPLILIGNYFFNTLPQDLFKIDQGQLQEGKVILTRDQQEKEPADLAQLINSLQTQFIYENRPNEERYYRDFPEIDSLLNFYCQFLKDMPFSIPLGALQAIHYFAKLAKGRLFMIAADQGVATIQQLNAFKPYLSQHDSFSMPVNYHALEHYFNEQQGMALLPTKPQTQFLILVATLGGKKEHYPETVLAFNQQIEGFEPYDYFSLMTELDVKKETFNLETLILLLKVGKWDPVSCHLFFNQLHSLLSQASKAHQEQLSSALLQVRANFYPIHPAEADFLINLGLLFFMLENYQEAIATFKQAHENDSTNQLAYLNLITCYNKLGQRELALKWQRRLHCSTIG